ncbi:MAG: peptidylprolyl isomerase [Acidobacteriota bacterium]
MKLTFLLTMAAVMTWAQTPAADPVVITVGTEKITKSMFENIISTLNEQQKQSLQAPEAKRSLAEQIAELTMMAQEGRKLGLDRTPAVQAKIVLQAQQVLASATYLELTKNPPSDADLQAFYKEHEKDWMEAKGRHILIRFTGSRVPPRDGQKDLTDEEALAKAKEVRAKLVAGAKFADLAKAESDDVGSGENGGDLGTFGPGQMVEEFDKVAFELPVGQLSEPVKTSFGYHLILIESRGAKPFETVRGEIEQALRPQMGAKAIEALKAKANITYDDAFFGKAPAAPAPTN